MMLYFLFSFTTLIELNIFRFLGVFFIFHFPQKIVYLLFNSIFYEQ